MDKTKLLDLVGLSPDTIILNARNLNLIGLPLNEEEITILDNDPHNKGWMFWEGGRLLLNLINIEESYKSCNINDLETLIKTRKLEHEYSIKEELINKKPINEIKEDVCGLLLSSDIDVVKEIAILQQQLMFKTLNPYKTVKTDNTKIIDNLWLTVDANIHDKTLRSIISDVLYRTPMNIEDFNKICEYIFNSFLKIKGILDGYDLSTLKEFSCQWCFIDKKNDRLCNSKKKDFSDKDYIIYKIMSCISYWFEDSYEELINNEIISMRNAINNVEHKLKESDGYVHISIDDTPEKTIETLESKYKSNLELISNIQKENANLLILIKELSKH